MTPRDDRATADGAVAGLRHAPPPRASVLASVGAAVLAAFAAAVGVFVPDFYRDAPTLVAQARGQDLLTLFVAVPALLASLALARKGSLRGYVVWLGVAGYLLYTYASYSFMSAFNPLYLAYVATLALSLVAFVGGATRLDPAAVKASLGGRPLRSVVAFELLVVVLVAGAWLAEIVPALLSGSVPESTAAADLPVNVIHSLDLGVVVPAFLAAAYWLARGEPWGYALSVVMLAKAATLGAAVVSMAAMQTMAGETLEPALLAVFGGLTAGSVALLAYVLRAMGGDADRDAPGGTDARVDG